MSSRSSGVVLLAGLSAVAAGYFLIFRRKKTENQLDTEELINETVDETSDIFNKSNENTELEEDSAITFKSELTVNITLEEELEDKLDEDVDIGDSGEESLDSVEEDSSVRRKNESLMEWIDRQLKEAESKGLGSAKTIGDEKKFVTNITLDKTTESSIVDNVLKEKGDNIGEDNDSIEIVSMTDSTFSTIPQSHNTTSDLTQSMVFVDDSHISPDSNEIQLSKDFGTESENKNLVDQSESDSKNFDKPINEPEIEKFNESKS